MARAGIIRQPGVGVVAGSLARGGWPHRMVSGAHLIGGQIDLAAGVHIADRLSLLIGSGVPAAAPSIIPTYWVGGHSAADWRGPFDRWGKL
jgi:hypothetical protein